MPSLPLPDDLFVEYNSSSVPTKVSPPPEACTAALLTPTFTHYLGLLSASKGNSLDALLALSRVFGTY
jgi:hypothetical protein